MMTEYHLHEVPLGRPKRRGKTLVEELPDRRRNQAARTMRTDKYEEFAVALCEQRPPPWACAERERIWRRIDQGRRERGAARTA